MKSILENVAAARVATALLRDDLAAAAKDVVAFAKRADEASLVVSEQAKARLREAEKMALTAQDLIDAMEIP